MNYAICYVSTAHNLGEKQVEHILSDSQEKNNQNKITGILLYSGGNFFQVLEGKKEILKPLFNHIKTDDRHYNLIKIFEKEIEKPQFEEYEVDFVSVDTRKNTLSLKHYLNQIAALDNSIQPSVKYILRQFTDGIK